MGGFGQVDGEIFAQAFPEIGADLTEDGPVALLGRGEVPGQGGFAVDDAVDLIGDEADPAFLVFGFGMVVFAVGHAAGGHGAAAGEAAGLIGHCFSEAQVGIGIGDVFEQVEGFRLGIGVDGLAVGAKISEVCDDDQGIHWFRRCRGKPGLPVCQPILRWEREELAIFRGEGQSKLFL